MERQSSPLINIGKPRVQTKKSGPVMEKALKELRTRLAGNGYADEIIDNIIKQIEPFVGGYAPAESNLRSQNSFNWNWNP